jgi:hypothetical protein
MIYLFVIEWRLPPIIVEFKRVVLASRLRVPLTLVMMLHVPPERIERLLGLLAFSSCVPTQTGAVSWLIPIRTHDAWLSPPNNLLGRSGQDWRRGTQLAQYPHPDSYLAIRPVEVPGIEPGCQASWVTLWSRSGLSLPFTPGALLAGPFSCHHIASRTVA